MGVERGPKSLLKGRFNNLNVYLIFVGNGKVIIVVWKNWTENKMEKPGKI